MASRYHPIRIRLPMLRQVAYLNRLGLIVPNFSSPSFIGIWIMSRHWCKMLILVSLSGSELMIETEITDGEPA